MLYLTSGKADLTKRAYRARIKELEKQVENLDEQNAHLKNTNNEVFADLVDCQRENQKLQEQRLLAKAREDCKAREFEWHFSVPLSFPVIRPNYGLALFSGCVS